MFFKKRNKSQIFVKDFTTKNNEEKIRLFSIGGTMKDNIIEQFDKNYLIEGDHIKSGGKASNKSILTLLGTGSGALGLSGLASGNLFMATVNPATLMTIGNGVGSAVMGTTGIIAQTPFIPVAGAIMPVIAPLPVMILNQFKTINEKLVSIEKSIERLIIRHEATFLGEIISAGNRLNDLNQEFAVTNQFSNEMIIRLSLIESKINPLFERYRYLYESKNVNKYLSAEDVSFKQTDAYLAVVLSILDLQLDVMRLKLSIQENPGYMSYSAKSLVEKVENYSKLWKNIENSPKKIKELSKELNSTVDSMNWWSKNIPSWLGGNRNERIKTEKEIKKINNINSVDKAQELTKTISNATDFGNSLKELTNEKPMSLIYWEDSNGKHSYYTNDLILDLENTK